MLPILERTLFQADSDSELFSLLKAIGFSDNTGSFDEFFSFQCKKLSKSDKEVVEEDDGIVYYWVSRL